MVSRWSVCLAVGLLVGIVHECGARDVFLTIGGGGGPTNNQISLERNVLLCQRYLAESFDENIEHVIFFADGEGDLRDLQFIDEGPIPQVNERLAQVFGQTGNLRHRYRSNEVPGIRGPATRSNLDGWFQNEATKLIEGDRLFVYVTAHGGKGERDTPENTKLYLWGRESIDVRQFHQWLTAVDPQVPVVVVMVQCYSGGFADMLYADMEKPIPVDRPWCGFYATVPDRVAAGCTADTKEEDYHEYSTYFFEALRGETRTGAPVTQPDFDGDGLISLEEAHSYVLINSKTIDISIRTSDQYLRKLEFEVAEGETSLDRDSDIETLRQFATPADLAVLDGLITELGIDPQEPSRGAEALADRMKDEKRDHDRDRRQAGQESTNAANGIKGLVTHRWPELSNPWSPYTQQLIVEQSDAIVQAIEGHPGFAKLVEQATAASTLGEESMSCERRWVKCQRLIRLLETLALRGNLEQFGDLDARETYQRLLSLEQVVYSRQPAGDAFPVSSNVR